MMLGVGLKMTKFFQYIFDDHAILEVVCDDLKEYRRELAFLRKLKLASKDSYNPIIETDFGDDGLGFEFCRLHNASIIRVMYRGN